MFSLPLLLNLQRYRKKIYIIKCYSITLIVIVIPLGRFRLQEMMLLKIMDFFMYLK